ncbi:MAG: alpha/beta fold hydrolase, partial [Candidatus Binataceae bacterium]
NFDLTEQIAGIEKPVLILAGAEDQGTTAAAAEFIKGKIRGAKLMVVADAAHNIPNERPEEVTAAIAQFLAELK